jgi:hypothetical protein
VAVAVGAGCYLSRVSRRCAQLPDTARERVPPRCCYTGRQLSRARDRQGGRTPLISEVPDWVDIEMVLENPVNTIDLAKEGIEEAVASYG